MQSFYNDAYQLRSCSVYLDQIEEVPENVQRKLIIHPEKIYEPHPMKFIQPENLEFRRGPSWKTWSSSDLFIENEDIQPEQLDAEMLEYFTHAIYWKS